MVGGVARDEGEPLAPSSPSPRPITAIAPATQPSRTGKRIPTG